MNKQVEQIRAEIERLYDGEAPKHAQQCDFDDGYFTGIGAISKFIDSLPDEQPSKDLEEEIKAYFQGYWPGIETAEQCNTNMQFTPPAIMRLARHFYELGQASVRMPEKPSKDLEEAAVKSAISQYKMTTDIDESMKVISARIFHEIGFKAGAKWQKEQDTADMLKSDFTVFNKCYEQGKKDIAKALLAKYKEEADKCPDADYDHNYTVAETQQLGRFMMMEDIYEEFCEPVGVTLDDLEEEK